MAPADITPTPIAPKGLLISAPASGTGKTTLTLGLLHALYQDGVAVHPFKCGPDYIDPAFHKAAAHVASLNLDSWSMPKSMLAQHITTAAGADMILAEGSMGLFDGVATSGASGTGATADIASLTGWPVVLVLNVSGQAQSAAAVAKGFATFRPGMPFAGVILNQVASPRHDALIRAGMADAGIRVFGSLPRQGAIELPERHLGLVQAEEQREHLHTILDQLAAFIRQHVDLAALQEAARSTGSLSSARQQVAPPAQHIALARDEAFSFVYPHLLDGWHAQGATISTFSPLQDEGPDMTADLVWLPGGYPELHAGTLAAADHFRTQLQTFAKTKPVHGECGGYMVLGEALIDKDGTRHAMTGLLGLVTSYAKRKMHLGYRKAVLEKATNGFGKGQVLAGHEFHYSTILAQPDAPLARVMDANGAEVPETGSWRGHASGTFFHLITEAA